MHVPVWHEATKKWQEQGRIQMVGIIEEQHPDRARLFMQWKQMHWPILVDSFDLLGVPIVPITLAIDEYGVIRMVNPKPEELEEEFLNRTFERPASLSGVRDREPDLDTLKQATRRDTVETWSAYANALVEWGGPKRATEAIEAYQHALRREPESGALHFRLGVAYRKRYDSDFRQPEDFQKAVEQWNAALQVNPNQYIWRRRIQQYGPRLDKPYSFYDWVTTARKEIAARGETPVPLLSRARRRRNSLIPKRLFRLPKRASRSPTRKDESFATTASSSRLRWQWSPIRGPKRSPIACT